MRLRCLGRRVCFSYPLEGDAASLPTPESGLSRSLNHTLDQLVVLEAIHRAGTFAAAARELHRVPSAVSYAVKGLESALGVTLFDRRGHRAVLTPEGRRILEAGQRVLEQAGALEALAGALRGGWEPELQIVVDGILPMSPVTRALRGFSEHNPPTRVRLDVEYREGVPERFRSDHADMMLVLGYDTGEAVDPDFVREPLPALVLWLVVAPDHALARARAVDRASLVDQVELVVKDSAPVQARQPRKTFMGSQHVVYLSDFHSKRLAVLEGAGFGWLPAHLVREDVERGRLVRIDAVDGNEWTYQPELIHRAKEGLGRAGTLFRRLLLAALHQ